MGFHVRHADAAAPKDAENRLLAWGLQPRTWSVGPGNRFDWHDHPQHKILFCVRGSITFHARESPDVELAPGDRLDLEPRTQHSATAGAEGVECVEAFAESRPG